MPAEIFGESYQFLPREEILSFEEISRLARIFVEFGVNKIRITGGEPLLRTDLPVLIAMLSGLTGVDDLTLTTNAYLLPQQARQLQCAGLKRITVSLDTMDEEVFKVMNGRGISIDRVLQGIDAADAVGLSPIKINAVVQKGVNDHTVVELARYFKDSGRIVRFIEYMDVGNRNGWKWDQVVPSAEVIQRINAEMPLEPIDSNYTGEVASRYRYQDGQGEIGVISSVSQPFCSNCTRARLSTDGKLYTCLFAANGVSLRDEIRAGASDDDLRTLISKIWTQRTDRYSEERTELAPEQNTPSKVEMYQIGG